MLNILLQSFFLLAISAQACLASDIIEQYVPDAELVGEGRLRVFFRDVYDARLIAPKGKLDNAQPFALELNYLMNLKGKKIADYSIKQIQKQGNYQTAQIETWSKLLKEIFPDVSKGQSITGIYTANGGSIFLADEELIGQVQDPELSKAFFNIWISENTSAPSLRKQLLGDS